MNFTMHWLDATQYADSANGNFGDHSRRHAVERETNMQESDYLANFLGPKAEQSEFVTRLVNIIMNDYFHWRRNYYPSDRPVLNSLETQSLLSEQCAIEDSLMTMLSRLRRSFPFYSPRYIAHQQGETTITSLLGSLAGILYNANNITSESGPETLEMEIEACSRLLAMLGFTPPPEPPADLNHASVDAYNHALAREYGWCHITSGGTVANIEALWIARATKYFPLMIHNVCIDKNISITVKFPNDNLQSESDRESDGPRKGESLGLDIRDIEQNHDGRMRLLNIRPNESLYLLRRYLQAVQKSNKDLPEAEAAALAWNWLKQEEEYGILRTGFARCMNDFPPVIFVTGAAHYSITKAASLLGLGECHIRLVAMDSRFRMDPQNLKSELESSYKTGCETTLAVIGIVGTTEEGAIDPLDEIVDVRRWSEKTFNRSFWVHADAAWGGYFRTLLNLSPLEEAEVIVPKILRALNLDALSLYEPAWVDRLFDQLIKMDGMTIDKTRDKSGDSRTSKARSDGAGPKTGRLPDDLDHLRTDCRRGVEDNDFSKVLRVIARLERHIKRLINDELTNISLQDLIGLTSDYVHEDLEIYLHRYDSEKKIEHVYSTMLNIRMNDPRVISSLYAMQSCDSITIDPHKMGFVNYACGAVAFRNDWARAVIQQRAPYITLTSASRVVHPPMRRIVEKDLREDARGYSTVIDSFGPFTLEGSRPSYPAAALWLTTEVSPLTRKRHGALIRASWLAAREVYEWLLHLDDALKIVAPIPRDFEVVFFASDGTVSVAPDTNLILFGIKKRGDKSIENFNSLNSRIHSQFAILAEKGDDQFSYGHPYFLSKTTMDEPHYTFQTLQSFFERYGFANSQVDYSIHGLTALRATVMSPYQVPLRSQENQFIARDFSLALARAIDSLTEPS